MPPVLALASALFSLAIAAPSPDLRLGPHITPEMDRWLMEGIDSIYRMEFERAETAARKAVALNPEHPHAYLGLAGVAWTRYVYETDQSDESLLEVYDQRVREAIRVGQKWLTAHPGDAQALFALGAAYGISSRLLIIRKEWLKGYWHGRKALTITRAAAKADPRLVDAQLGLGMYDYYSDVLPRFIGVLARIVLRGNRPRGIETLERVAREGHYSKSNAMILLVEIYTEDPYGAKDPAKAVALMKELRALYPESAMMHSAQFVALHVAQRYGEAVEAARDYLARVQQGRYNPIEAGKGSVGLGCALWAAGRKEEALEALLAATHIKHKGALSRWAVWAHIRAGRLLDTMGRRGEALEHYRAAIAEPDRWDMRRLAKANLSKPFDAPHPGPIPPPY